MNTTTTTTWPGPHVIQPAIERPTAMRLAQTEYQRVTDAVDALQFEDWTRPTDCTEWDVRQLVAHIAGQANLFSTPSELTRQMRSAKAQERRGQAGVDALTAAQVEERQHLGPDELRTELRRVGPRGAKGRRRAPGFLRRRPPTGDRSRQRCTGGMVARIRDRCDPHSRPVDAPPGPRPGDGSNPGAHRRPRRRHRRRHRC